VCPGELRLLAWLARGVQLSEESDSALLLRLRGSEPIWTSRCLRTHSRAPALS
jgi:hypothetical protein